MKRALLILLCGAVGLLGRSASAQIVSPQGVLSTGGGRAQSSLFTVCSAIGQPTTGIMTDAIHASEVGFWYPRNQICLLGWSNHNVGDCILTITNQGILGFTDGAQSEGSGFIYPAGGENHIYIGGLWVGESPEYVANRDYDADPDREWIVSRAPDGHVWEAVEGSSHQDLHASFTDSAATQPRGLFVTQESWAHAYNDLAVHHAIIRYRLINMGDSSLENLYVGLFLDIDIRANHLQNSGAVDELHNLVYMTDASGIHIGLRLLEDSYGPPLPSNLTLIHNPTYVWPGSHIPDADKYGFLTAADPEHVLLDSEVFGDSDYSVLAATGPIDLEPGEETVVAFAVAGGETLYDLQQHTNAAQIIYQSGFADAPEGPDGIPPATRLIGSRPNPFQHQAVIAFDLARATKIELSIYDINGRLVRMLARGSYPAMHYALAWDGRNDAGREVSGGVYFLRLEAGETRESRRLIRLR